MSKFLDCFDNVSVRKTEVIKYHVHEMEGGMATLILTLRSGDRVIYRKDALTEIKATYQTMGQSFD